MQAQEELTVSLAKQSREKDALITQLNGNMTEKDMELAR